MEDFVFRSKARIAISPICNMQCIYCDNSRGDNRKRVIAMEDFRLTPLSKGIISTQDYLTILHSLLNNGFNRVDFTGGEPMLNHDWDYMVSSSKIMGFKSVEMTTNGSLINSYLKEKAFFPKELDRLIISLDTDDFNEFEKITHSSYNLNSIISSIKDLKESNPSLKLTANCVLRKSANINIKEYLRFIKEVGFDGITFLDLVVRDVSKEAEVNYFRNEFISGDIIKNYIQSEYSGISVYEDRHSYNVILPNGLSIGLSDTKGLTKRDDNCNNCPCYCQEGLYTIRVATDGAISDCMGPYGIHFDAKLSIKNKTLDRDINRIYRRLASSIAGFHFSDFIDSLSGGQVG